MKVNHELEDPWPGGKQQRPIVYKYLMQYNEIVSGIKRARIHTEAHFSFKSYRIDIFVNKNSIGM